MRIAVPLLDAGSFAGLDGNWPVHDLAGETMGTCWRVRLAAPNGTDFCAMRAAIQDRLNNLVAQMSHWDAGSLLYRFNRAHAGTRFTLPDDFATVIGSGLAVARATGGAFDPAIGRLTDLYGLGPDPRSVVQDAAEIRTAQEKGGWQRLEFDPASSGLLQPGGVWLDLSGIAKGYAVDAIADLLTAHVHRHVLVEIGGECVGLGLRPDGDPWWVDLETPPGLRVRPLRIALHQCAVATSGDYVRGAHTLDPRSGTRLANGIASVSVLHRQAMLADAWATAIGVLGWEDGAAFAIAQDLAVRILMRDGAMTREWLSPALLAMLAD